MCLFFFLHTQLIFSSLSSFLFPWIVSGAYFWVSNHFFFFGSFVFTKKCHITFLIKKVSMIFSVISNTLLDWNWYWFQWLYGFVTHYNVPEYFEHLSLEQFCIIICQHHLCWTVLDFHFPFIYSVHDKKYHIFICLDYPVQ